MKILLFGNTEVADTHINGQTIKTLQIVQALIDCKVNLDTCNTSRYNFLKMLQILTSIHKYDCIIVLPGYRMIQWLYPIIAFTASMYKRLLTVIVIGGWKWEFAQKKKQD